MSDCQLLKNVPFMDCADVCCECFICVQKKSQKSLPYMAACSCEAAQRLSGTDG